MKRNRLRRGELRTGERGSALLIVFVFAAILAIMLYEEMPVAAFEAQRQKEQLLIDRGNEYAHAVKLFVRKVGTYPSSMEALENTNQMRFLRHRFKDPLTGKDDWRVLHAGPNGMLTDSKVKPISNGQNGSSASGQNGSTTDSASFGFSSNNSASGQGSSGFGSSSFGSSGFGSDSSSTSAAVVVPPVRQRPPAVAANGSATPTSTAADQNPLDPLISPEQAAAGTTLPVGTSPSGTTGTPGQANTGQAGTNGFTGNGNGAGGAGSWTAGKYSLGQQPTTGGSSTGMGTINSGGIAGVASIAKGHSIKVVNDQTDYSLWEFYYDPTKDAKKGLANAVAGMGTGQQTSSQSPFGQSTSGQNQQQNGFGSSSAFGSSSGTNSTFGSSSGSSTTTSAPSSGTSTQSPQSPQ